MADAAPPVAAAEAGQRIPFPLVIPFVDTLGLELWHFAGGRAELRLTVTEALHNSWQVTHGGVLMTLLDVAMAHAARSVIAAEPLPGQARQGMATIEMKTTFYRPAQGRLRALGELVHRTAQIAFAEGRIYDEQGHLCAQATGTFKVLAGLPVGQGEAKRIQHRNPTFDQ